MVVELFVNFTGILNEKTLKNEATSHLNFIITNKVIIGQTYSREGMPDKIKAQDEEAKRILSAVFPNRKVVILDALAVNLGGGGLHCISMHQPELHQ